LLLPATGRLTDPMDVSLWFWALFLLFVAGMLALDLGVFNRTPHAVSAREAAAWTGVWVTLALLFNLGLYLTSGSGPALQFLTGYLVEKSLAVDNIFVFVLIFSAFAVPPVYQHRVLFWGIIGALVMRGALIVSGSYLVDRFHWVLYLFGAFLVLTGVKLFRERDEHELDVDGNLAVRALRRVVPVSNAYIGHRFLVRDGARWIATPLFVVMAIVMVTDLVFAVDSIPAIFAISQDPFVVFTSNVFAVLGLRSMYFLLADVIQRFAYLRHGLSVILVFIGGKMLLVDVYEVPTVASLGAIVLIFAVAIAASLRAGEQPDPGLPAAPERREGGREADVVATSDG
jgi:tellurite resistance protein TerC